MAINHAMGMGSFDLKLLQSCDAIGPIKRSSNRTPRAMRRALDRLDNQRQKTTPTKNTKGFA